MKKIWLIMMCFLGCTGFAQGQTVITLEKAMEIAAEHSPSIRRVRLNLDRTRYNLQAQNAALKSSFSMSVNPLSYSQSRRFDERISTWYTNKSMSSSGTFQISQPILLTDGTISLVNRFSWQDNESDQGGITSNNKAFTNNLNLQLTQPLFTYNTRKMELKELEFDYENAHLNFAVQMLNLERQVSQLFYNVYMAQMNLDIAREELNNAEQNFEIIKNKVEADLSAREELYQAEVNIATSRSSFQNRVVSFEEAKDIFKLNLGMDLDEDIVISANVEASPVPVDEKLALENALRSRIELRQREITYENSVFQMIRVKAQNEFRGNLNLSVGIIGDNRTIGDIYQNPTQNPSVALTFNVPIFDWGAKKARIKAQEATMASNEIDAEQERKEIILNVRQVFRNLQNQLTQIDIASQNVRNAQLTYDLNQERYRNGDLRGLDMNQYQTQLSSRKIAHAQALINYKLELLNMKIQSMYDFETNTPLVPSELVQKGEINRN
jgi:outer membrane protein TolC